MAEPSAPAKRPGFIKRMWRALASPSAKWSVLSLLIAGIVIGGGGVIVTDVIVKRTGTVEFCGEACHSMKAFTFPEYKESSHYSNKAGVAATCADCHIPHSYPTKLFYKARAGIKDIIGEARGVISTQEKYEKERWRMANHVWDEMKANDSANCRHCHDWNAMALSEQRPMAQSRHEKARKSGGTCIDCHKGIAHKEPEEPEQPADRKSEDAGRGEKAAAK
jgi:nitrate/TMAO reductase-like tetraheme cytochrome c subunit